MFVSVLVTIPTLNLANATIALTIKQNKTYISSDSCEDIALEVESIMSLPKANSKMNIHKDNEYYLGENNQCNLEVSTLLPQLFSKLNNVYAGIEQINCWNFAFYSTGTINNIKFTDAKDVDSILNSPLCQKISDDEVVPGDLGFIKDQSGNHVHAYVYVSKNLSFAKHGWYTSDPFLLKTQKLMFDWYGRTPNCRQKGLYSDDCFNKNYYYRCTAINDYIDKVTADKQAEALVKVLTNLNSIDNSLEELYINKKYQLSKIDLPKKDPENSPLYKEIQVKLLIALRLATQLHDYNDPSVFSDNLLSHREQTFFRTIAKNQLYTTIRSIKQLIRMADYQRNLDQKDFTNLYDELKSLDNNLKW